MSTSTSFSAIIPTYNRAYILRDAIDSALAQNVPGLQVIVVDDGSTDATRSLVAEYGARVQYIFQKNQGMASACNAGFRVAEGEFIGFLDSDDVWLPNKVSTELRLFALFSQADAIASDAESWAADRLVNPSWLRMKDCPIPSQEPFFFPVESAAWIKSSLFATCCLTHRRSNLARFGDPLWNRSVGWHCDWDLEIRVLNSSRVLVTPQILAKIRRYPDETRGNRPLPGTPPTPVQRRAFMQERFRVLDNALRLAGWTADIRARLETAHAHLLQELSQPVT